MAFIVKKTIKNKEYYYLNENKRIGEKVKTKTLAYLGKTKKEAEKKSREIMKNLSEKRKEENENMMKIKRESPEEKKEFEALREEVIQKILTAPDEELLSVKEVDIPAPEKARIYPSLRCQECGETFMEIMGRTANGKVVCRECFERMTC